ncbi:hypothetical protein COT47_07560 [Candidatus Woesearchaeota archaeon CG08_land_8_20_14_0_20_43_7]|nr:MAG: hypothetical protein COT47_07560 [Candidatus Woesearchaeota archaeon CG08_land_8_20_14_0_20_43_7]
MRRKVNRVGQSTLTVSLPSQWARKHKIKPGDEINVDEDGNALMLWLDGKNRKVIKERVIVADKTSKIMLAKQFHEFYWQGVECIRVKYSKNKIADYKNNKSINLTDYVSDLLQRFIGFEIISQKNNEIVINSLITTEESEKIISLERRIYYLVKEFLFALHEIVDTKSKMDLKVAYQYHDNIAKFIHYYLRSLFAANVSEPHKYRKFALYLIIDKIIDKLRHTAERIDEAKIISPKFKVDLNDIFNVFLELYDFIFAEKINFEKLEELIKHRYDVVHRINNTKYNLYEARIIMECKILLDVINDFSQTLITREIVN